jgi:hypothetical protein
MGRAGDRKDGGAVKQPHVTTEQLCHNARCHHKSGRQKKPVVHGFQRHEALKTGREIAKMVRFQYNAESIGA